MTKCLRVISSFKILGMVAMGANNENPTFLRRIEELRQGNAAAIPIPETLHHIPWASNKGDLRAKLGAVMCETNWILDGEPQQACPRYDNVTCQDHPALVKRVLFFFLNFWVVITTAHHVILSG